MKISSKFVVLGLLSALTIPNLTDCVFCHSGADLDPFLPSGQSATYKSNNNIAPSPITKNFTQAKTDNNQKNAFLGPQDKVQKEQVQMPEYKEFPSMAELGLTSRSAFLFHPASGTVLFSENASQKLPMASMTKTMTLLLIAEEVEKGNLNLSSSTTISEYAASQEGSECFLDAGQSYALSDLVRAVIIASANDATVALAEHVAGSENLFVQKMNERAQELGLSSTHFANSTGLDTANHYSTAEDISKILKELSRHTDFMSPAKTWMDELKHQKGRITELTNTNRLIKTNPDCVMGKTGFTDGAGYCLVALGKRGDTELIACCMGAKESKDRFNDVTKLFSYGFSSFQTKTIVNKSEPVGVLTLKNAKLGEVEVFPSQDATILVPKGQENTFTYVVSLHQNPVSAPLKKGTIVGLLSVLNSAGEEVFCTDVVTNFDVEEVTLLDIVKDLASA